MTALVPGDVVSAPLYPGTAARNAWRWGVLVRLDGDEAVIRSGSEEWRAKQADVRVEP